MNEAKIRDKFYADLAQEVSYCLEEEDCLVAYPPTAEQCKQLFYEKWGPTEENNAIVHVGDYISAVHLDECIPAWLVSNACAYALSLVNWTEIANRVQEEFEH